MKKSFKILVLLALALSLAFSQAIAAEIKIGVLSDLSGATSDVGRPYADGIKACAEYLNKQNFIPGHQIKLLQDDYAYQVPQALNLYNKFKSQGIVALQGWGTGDTEALVKFVSKDQIPTFSASYSAHLTDPKAAPYNFFIAADYSTQLRAGLKYLKDSFKEKRAPKIAFVYPSHPYGLSPIEAGKAYAKEIGFEIVGDANVDLKAIDATPQLLGVQKLNPDFVWIGGTTASTSVILKDALKLKMTAKFLMNIWGNDENLIKLAGPAVNGNFGMQSAVVYGQNVPGMKIIMEMSKNQPQMTHYIRGFASMYVMGEAIRRAAAKGPITGPSIKEAAETLRDFDPLGLTPPVSFFPNDHRPNMAVFVYQFSGDKMNLVATSKLDRKAEWLGK